MIELNKNVLVPFLEDLQKAVNYAQSGGYGGVSTVGDTKGMPLHTVTNEYINWIKGLKEAEKTEVYPCGTKVNIKLLNAPAIITGITIRNQTIVYELSFFSNGERQQEWMNEYEFTTSAEKEYIGFKNGKE